ncbi:hypothetical protein LPW26_17695 [Rhodopseudomonas sp. HC1]|uniref:hypothetical protein n=1 Tax=Rhodopseudomonas infernalis TaxID=2897386 RepID=UPI001EE802C8|nr:hypothetical protein [Rhodopseudomonas infernalis]MCG6206485.1 hypothetical protein [Rhodopseudomonas infernalis]
MGTSSKSSRSISAQPASADIGTSAASVDHLASTINLAIEQAEDLGIGAAVQLLMMARLEVDLTEIARETKTRTTA